MASTRIAIVSTGGTIEKTYDELDQVLHNRVSVLDVMLASLQLRGTELTRVPLMNKDSTEMSPGDHDLIARTARSLAECHDGVVVVHGTDTLGETGDRMCEGGDPATPIILTGAMRPYELRTSDAVQNLTEALVAARVLPAGVYLAMHGEIRAFPGVTKDARLGEFVGGRAVPPRDDKESGA